MIHYRKYNGIKILSIVKLAGILFSGIFFMNAAFSEEGQEVDESDCYYNLFVDTSDIDAALVTCADEFAKGNARSGYWLGVYYGHKNMPEKFFFYIQRAAEMGDAYSLFSIGSAYMNGKSSEHGFPKDIDKGLSYIKKAADKGYGYAQFFYAYNHDRGARSLGIETNLTLALDYYNRAVENGDRVAMLELASKYLHCTSGNYAPFNAIICDREKGLSYHERAAKMGFFPAQFELGKFHFKEKNWTQSKYWFSLFLAWERPLYADMSMSVGSGWKEEAKQYLEKIPASTVVTIEDNLYERYWQEACQYKDHSWYYKCRKEEDK